MAEGTNTTLKLGSGERGAAVSSFKEAYGITPKTEADWIDVLNIANGRWPLTVVKPVEARAYTNFTLVYGRNADMKNSTDVNALKMMGYGVRSTTARDLNAEKNAIQTFIKTFGFGPSNARHWNIIRAIAYSGVVLKPVSKQSATVQLKVTTKPSLKTPYTPSRKAPAVPAPKAPATPTPKTPAEPAPKKSPVLSI